MASAGVQVLASEIVSFWSKQGNGLPLSVCLPGGTSSTGLLLHRELRRFQDSSETDWMDIRVVVIPCVGDGSYARRQMLSLSTIMGASVDDIPTILAPAPENSIRSHYHRGKDTEYFTFGEPDERILHTFESMRDEYGLVLDLLYGAPAWTIMLRHWDTLPSVDLDFDPINPLAGREIMYVHTGGLEGINSQLLRYQYKGLIALDDIQLPGRDKR